MLKVHHYRRFVGCGHHHKHYIFSPCLAAYADHAGNNGNSASRNPAYILNDTVSCPVAAAGAVVKRWELDGYRILACYHCRCLVQKPQQAAGVPLFFIFKPGDQVDIPGVCKGRVQNPAPVTQFEGCIVIPSGSVVLPSEPGNDVIVAGYW